MYSRFVGEYPGDVSRKHVDPVDPRSFVELVTEPALVADATGTATPNAAICDLLGVSRRRRTIVEILPVAAADLLWDLSARIRPREVTLKQQDGASLFCEVSVVDLSLGGVDHALMIFRDVSGMRRLGDELRGPHDLHGLIGGSPAMREVKSLIRSSAQTLAPVLVTGATGTGKEVAARAIHAESPRRDRPFVAVNCGALPEGLIESELFGHTRGAFTGAHRDKRGQFVLADGGTLFLDEIGELPLAVQVKLLRVLQDKRVLPVGAEHSVRVDVRVIAATNQDLEGSIRRRAFRDDLYYRLCVVPIRMPLLNERGDDIIRIASALLARIAEVEGGPQAWLSADARRVLLQAAWPGNVRELANALHYAVVRSGGGAIEVRHLPESVRSAQVQVARVGRPRKVRPEDILDALRRAQGSKTRAARILGISRATLYRYHAELENA